MRTHLDSAVQKASTEYALDVSRKLKAGYDEIVVALKQQQQQWQRAQDTALKMVQSATAGKDTGWQSIVDRSKALEQELRGAIAAA